MADTQKRQIAYKTSIKTLVQGNYVKQEGWQPNYILTKEGRQISRVNLMATIVSIQNNPQNQKTMLIDDGTANISVRSFEDTNITDGFDIGDLVMIVGRPREFGELKYIVPEIIRKLKNTKWVNVRQRELESIDLKYSGGNKGLITDSVKEEYETPTKKQNENPKQKVYQSIKSLDKGGGADIEEVIKLAQVKDCEEIIKMLLKEGEIFEIGKGRLKVLE